MPRIRMTRSIQFAGRPLDERAGYTVTPEELRELMGFHCCVVVPEAPAAAAVDATPPPELPAPTVEMACAAPETETAAARPVRARRLRPTAL